MTKLREKNPEWFDSLGDDAFSGIPTGATPRHVPPPLPARARTALGSSPELEPDLVAVIASPALRTAIERALDGIPRAGEEALSAASVVVAELEGDPVIHVGALRGAMRADAALLLVDPAGAPTESRARAATAGAFACVGVPAVPGELRQLVAAALDSRMAKAQIADLTRKLDLHAHLASIGRMSAGLAHEVANPLAVATANQELLGEAFGRLLELAGAFANATPESLPRLVAEARAMVAHAQGEDGGPALLREIGEAHARIQSLLETMRALVNEQVVVRRERIDLRLLALDVAHRWLAAETKGVDVTVVGDAVAALGDPTLLGQIVQNLAANALHAAKTLATPKLRLHTYAADGFAVLSVRDNGPGIPPELHERVFEPFYTTRRGRGGTGLGLALCREYAVRMGASLSLWSMPGRGTCFRVSLPLAR